MKQWIPKVAKNSVALLNLCREKGLSHERIIEIVSPIGNASAVEEKEKIAEQLITKVKNM